MQTFKLVKLYLTLLALNALFLFSACATPVTGNLKSSYKLYYNPSIFHTEIVTQERQQLSQALSSSDIAVQVLSYDLPFDTRKYNFENIKLGKNNSPAFVKASADFGIVNTYEYLDLLRFNSKLRPIAYFSTEEGNQKQTCSLDAEIVVPVNSKIKTLEELKTKRMVTIYPESRNLFPIKVFIIDNKISPTNVQLVDSVKELKAMMANGEADAAIDSVEFNYPSGLRQSFFKRELAENQKPENIKYKSFYKTEYRFPCFLIFAKTDIENAKIQAFLNNFSKALKEEKLSAFKIGKITSTINPNTLKRLLSVATESVDLYQKAPNDK